MNYQLEKPKTVRGMTFQVVCCIDDTTVIRERSLFVSRRKTPIFILMLGDGEPRVLDLNGTMLTGKILEDIQNRFPSIREQLN